MKVWKVHLVYFKTLFWTTLVYTSPVVLSHKSEGGSQLKRAHSDRWEAVDPTGASFVPAAKLLHTGMTGCLSQVFMCVCVCVC